tara:strand:+ start:27834 stop:28994 length:1161 start_codon:yes stop_codon:yes gene_type:complete
VPLFACLPRASRQADAVHSARHLNSRAQDVAQSLRRRGREVWPLIRRNADLGQVVTVHRDLPDVRTETANWRAGEPIFLPAVLGDATTRFAAEIDASLRMFDRLRDGGEFLPEIDARLADDLNFRYAGSTVDQEDPREVERLFVDAEIEGVVQAEDLWAKLAWITAEDPTDESLRIRFSNGLDQLEEWMLTSDLTASWVDQFALRAFPECEAVLRCKPLRERLDRLIARPHRLSERIIYNNAPNGGAIFHHDAEPSQLGVVFTQLEGRTAWFTLGKRRLAKLLVRFGMRSEHRAMTALNAADDRGLLEILNRDADFAALLAAHGALFLLQAGDSILLPTAGFDDTAWHSVLAVGDQPSIAHSYGIFGRQDDYQLGGDPWLTRQPDE